MEVATTNNHSQSHHHHHHHHRMPHLGTNGGMALNGSAGKRSPFQREVREWQHIDPDTGALLSGRLEADRWINGPLNSYGKISDSQNISQPNGTHHTQRKQLEVLQAHTAKGAMQVIRAQTVQTTSSRWSSSTSATCTSTTSSLMPSLITSSHGIGSSSSGSLFSSHNPKTSLAWPQPLSSSVEISEVSSDTNSDIDGSLNGETVHGHNFLLNGKRGSRTGNFPNLHSFDTAPSLKLSNLMKSSSSISSNNSSGNNSTVSTPIAAIAAATMATAAPTMNTHQQNAGKISLHAIVGNGGDKTLTATSLAAAAAAATSTVSAKTTKTTRQQQQHLEQAALYGGSNSTAKSHVGVAKAVTVGAVAGADADADDELHQKRQQQNFVELTPTQLKRHQQQQRRDLESFRHYNEHETTSSSTLVSQVETETVTGHDDDDLRLSERHQRRQQMRHFNQTLPLQRTRSISTDDLSAEWDAQNSEDEAPGEWRRVSKLRRSFQNNDSYKPAPVPQPRRPLDLPTNTVSVAKIRAELENGRRLNTAMRNNHVDLAALDTLLNDTVESKTSATKQSSFLTAESLKEIRGKLKRLSDESLYKEDFLAHHQQPPVSEEHIEVEHFISKPQNSAFQPQTKLATNFIESRKKNLTHSLESRQKYRDAKESSEWHIRRKSYGFEKMSPPDDKSMNRMDASTDSGLGRSGELGNWSPTTESTPAVTPGNVRATVIQFGAPTKALANANAVRKRYSHIDSVTATDNEGPKRHSIAVDESQYVRENLRKTSQVHLNGFYNAAREVEKSTTESSLFQRTSQQKRVEFCKTEVHFAAESGRVNIVETDGKPPPTNNFRRRRRTTAATGPLQSLVSGAPTVDSPVNSVAIPITHFGDDKRIPLASTTVAYKAPLEPAHDTPRPVMVSVPKISESSSGSSTSSFIESTRHSYASTSTSGVDTTDNENDENGAIRGILKNKPIKPKPYHLGDNFESPNALWGVQLKPVGKAGINDAKTDAGLSNTAHKSVTDHMRFVEKRQEHASHGFSTKINVSLGDASKDWQEKGTTPDPTKNRTSAQEMILQDLREHQRILDEGLKSTSLIIKTMRSATEFDEAMRRLSIASLEAAVIPPIVVPTPMLRSHSYQENSRSYPTNNWKAMSNTSRSENSSTNNSMTKPASLKFFDTNDMPISQQLSQLKKMYEVVGTETDDSADEEVKSYFPSYNDNSDSGGGTLESSSLEDERATEYSGSWSRLKAKRTIWKIEANDRIQQQQMLESKDLPNSNVMNIELHSPHSSLEKTQLANDRSTPPIAKPRTITKVQQPTLTVNPSETNTSSSLKIIKEARGARKLREHELSYFGVQADKTENLSNGIRKYPSTHQGELHQKPHRTLPPRKLIDHHEESQTNSTMPIETKTEKQTTKWQLMNDKPDLLRHSAIVVEPQVMTRVAEIKPTERRSLKARAKSEKNSREHEEDDDDLDDHIYENISNELKPVFKVKSNQTHRLSYDRKLDLKRDAQILSEMTKNADQTMKAISDEAAIKDQRRRSISRRNSQPLETINEKATSAEKIKDACVAVKVTRHTVAAEAKRPSRHSTPSPTGRPTMASRARTSSQSSVESCPRDRSRSLSSEREYENVKSETQTKAKHRPITNSALKTRSTKTTPTKTISKGSRSSSRESQRSSHTQCSSGDEINRRDVERVRAKSKRSSTSAATKTQASSSKERKSHTASEEKQRHHRATRTVHSSQRERITCPTEASIHHQHHTVSSGVSPMSSSRRIRTDHEAHKSTSASRAAGAGEKHERHERHVHDSHTTASSNGIRLLKSSAKSHEDHRSHRVSPGLEREKTKEKLSRSKGHSSRSTPHHQSERHETSNAQSPKVIPSTKSREHKKSSSKNAAIASSHNETTQNDVMTHSKNSYLTAQPGHCQYHQHTERYPAATQAVTIAAKHQQRVRSSGKDRK